jgi:hypothetical protein
VDMLSASSGAAHESLDKAKRACVVGDEVGMTELEANIDAMKFRTVNRANFPLPYGRGVKVNRIMT